MIFVTQVLDHQSRLSGASHLETVRAAAEHAAATSSPALTWESYVPIHHDRKQAPAGARKNPIGSLVQGWGVYIHHEVGKRSHTASLYASRLMMLSDVCASAGVPGVLSILHLVLFCAEQWSSNDCVSSHSGDFVPLLLIATTDERNVLRCRYLKWDGLPESLIGASRGAGAVLGIAGTIFSSFTPRLPSCDSYGLVARNVHVSTLATVHEWLARARRGDASVAICGCHLCVVDPVHRKSAGSRHHNIWLVPCF